MRLIKEIINSITIIHLDDKRLDTSNSGLLKSEFTNLITSEKINKLVVDLTNIENCDSSGLSALLVINRLIEDVFGTVRFLPSDRVRQLFLITKLDRILISCENINQAVEQVLKSNH
jgi:anti-anti-sigma factor